MQTVSKPASPAILITGATGYVGGRLRMHLEQQGVPIRCMARNPENLSARVADTTEVVRGDVLDPASLPNVLHGIQTAYYLVHSLGEKTSFSTKEQSGALNFAEAAAHAGVRRIIYVSGLGTSEGDLSPHLKSRHGTGKALRTPGIPVIELRASIIIGAGSISFEMIRALTQKLPVMTTPRWVFVKTQPIAISDLITIMTRAADIDTRESRIIEVGGKDVVSYADLIKEYARQRGLKRYIIPLPILSPWLSSLWLGIVTPLFARVGRKLVLSLKHPTVVTDPEPMKAFIEHPLSMSEAIERAIQEEESELLGIRWTDALSTGGTYRTWAGTRFRTRLLDHRTIDTDLPPEQAFDPIQRIGGKAGWYAWNSLWKIRGVIDILLGGVGLRRSRSHPLHLIPGDTVDCWRVEKLEPGRLLRLAAEMKLPGRAWLELEVIPHGSGSTIRQTAIFDPVGVAGLAYWYGIYPLHVLVFRGMLRGIAEEGRRSAAQVDQRQH